MPQFQTSDGLNLSYRVLGSGAPVILLHGWSVDGSLWNSVTEALTTVGLQLIIPDQRGAGSSDKPDSGYGIEQYAADVGALADALELDRFALMGHSMGGQIAQVAAADLGERVEKLALVCPVPAAGFPLPPEAMALFRGSAGNPEMQTTIFGMSTKQLDDAGLAAMLEMASTVCAPCVEQSLDAWTKGGFGDRPGKISAETVVVGTDDPFLTPEILDQTVVQPIPGARFVHLPGPGHYPQIEAPAQLGAILAGLF